MVSLAGDMAFGWPLANVFFFFFPKVFFLSPKFFFLLLLFLKVYYFFLFSGFLVGFDGFLMVLVGFSSFCFLDDVCFSGDFFLALRLIVGLLGTSCFYCFLGFLSKS